PYEGEAGRTRPDEVRFLATDISAAALDMAKKNAQRYGVADRIEFLQGSMLAPLTRRHIDLIVSNPPYLPAEALAKAGRAIDTLGLLFEPRIALDGGVDGQDFVQQIQQSEIPALVESTNGEIHRFNF
ncbi:MAG: methyltransferase, partial [Patescibacteria group bacterium]